MFDWLFGVGRESFARRVRDEIAASGQFDEVTVEKGGRQLKIVRKDKSIHWLTLRSHFDEYKAADDKEGSIRHAAATVIEHRSAPQVFAMAKSNLVPRLKLRSSFEHLKACPPVEGIEASIPYRAIGDAYGVCVGWESPHLVQLVDGRLLKAWSVSFEDALAIAAANLRRKDFQPQAMMLSDERDSPAYCFHCEDDHAGGRILLREEIETLKLRGAPVAIAVNQGRLLFAGDQDQDSLYTLAAVACKLQFEPGWMSGRAVRFDGGVWRDWLPPEEGRVRDLFDLIRCATLQGEYDGQKEDIQKQLGEDVFVASYTMFQSARTAQDRFVPSRKG